MKQESSQERIPTHIIQCHQDQRKLRKIFDAKSCFFDVRMMRCDLALPVELEGGIARHLHVLRVSAPFSCNVRWDYLCFGTINMLFTEEELSVQVAQVNGIEVDLSPCEERGRGGGGRGAHQFNVMESGQHQVFQ